MLCRSSSDITAVQSKDTQHNSEDTGRAVTRC